MIRCQLKKRLKFSHGDDELEVDFEIKENDFTVIFGPSGAGKTTLLRLMAGFDKADAGYLAVNQKVFFDSSRGINLKPQNRKIGFVFQDYALFPSMTVLGNLQFAQHDNDHLALNEVADLLKLKGLLDRKPDSLSGGQKQRVAIARAILRKPQILFLDEPLAALDVDTRDALQNELVQLHRKLGLTTIMISHDLPEIARLANRVIVLEKGKILKAGEPLEVFTENKISGKVKIVGEIVAIRQEDVIYILTIVTGNNFIKAVVTESEVEKLSVGNKVMVVSKAFNPMVVKIK